jgi:hypothetical protein
MTSLFSSQQLDDSNSRTRIVEVRYDDLLASKDLSWEIEKVKGRFTAGIYIK